MELKPFEDHRWQFMFWRGDPMPEGLKIEKPRVRDLRPGDTIVFGQWCRLVLKVEIFR